MSLESKARSLEKLLDDFSLIESDTDNRIALEKEYVPLEEAQKDKADAINQLELEKNREYSELDFAMAKAVKAEAERYGKLYNQLSDAKENLENIRAFARTPPFNPSDIKYRNILVGMLDNVIASFANHDIKGKEK